LFVLVFASTLKPSIVSYCIVYMYVLADVKSQSIPDQRHVCEAYGTRYNKVPGCCNNTWGKDRTYLLWTWGDEEQVNWILSSQRLPGLTKNKLHFCWLYTAGLQDLLSFLYSLQFFHHIFHVNIFIVLLISKPHSKKPCCLHFMNKEECTTSWNLEIMISSLTENRKMEFVRIIQAYPPLIVCGLSFESIVSMGKRLVEYLEKDQDLEGRLVIIFILVHVILRISPHHSHHLRSYHLTLPRPFTTDLKLMSFTNTFLRSHSDSFWTTFTVLNLYWIKGAVAFVCFSFFIFIFFWLRVLD